MIMRFQNMKNILNADADDLYQLCFSYYCHCYKFTSVAYRIADHFFLFKSYVSGFTYGIGVLFYFIQKKEEILEFYGRFSLILVEQNIFYGLGGFSFDFI